MDEPVRVKLERDGCVYNGPLFIYLADLNGDGCLDLLIGGSMPSLTEPHDSFVYVYWNGPHGLSEDNHRGDSAVWWNAPEGFSAARTTRLPTSGPHGMTSVEPGNIADRGPEEFFVSEPYRVPEGSSVESIRWEGDIPFKTWVRGIRGPARTSGLALR